MSIKRSAEARHGSAGNTRPEGIIVLDALPPAPDPRVQAFIWCPSDPRQVELLAPARRTPLPGALMVGLFRQVTQNGEGIDAGNGDGLT